ncbi:toll-like receptor 6 isoform X2 [Malaya genurostris]|nr:toll-like receptor 6 isoform X2 [Malaya genurostris]
MKPFLMKGMPQRLKYLSMARSGLTSLPMFELTLVNGTLTHLSLMDNVIIPFKLPVLRNLRILDLRHCGLSYLPDEAFVNTPSLFKLFLSHNSLTKLSSSQFLGLTSLRHLDISYNAQEKMSGLAGDEQMIDPYNSLTEGLYLNDTVFDPLVNLSFLDVSHTKLLSYSSKAFRHVTVKQLSLCYTDIAIIVGSMINGSLRVLDISGNPGISTAIHHEQSDTRSFNNNLEILVCENSTVKHLDWLSGMINLKVLLLGTNNINQLKNCTFENLAALEILDLSGNHISNWHQRVFTNNAELYILDLSDNNINVLTTEMLYDFASVNFLAIGQNSFVCHCLLREFIEMAAKNSETISCLLNNLVDHFQTTSDATRYDEVLEYLYNSGFLTTANPIDDKVLNASTKTVDAYLKIVESFIVTESSLPNFQEENYTVILEGYEPEDIMSSIEEYDVLSRLVQGYVSIIYDSNTKFQESLNKYRIEPTDPRFIRINCSNDSVTTNQPSTNDQPSSTDPLYGLQFQIIDFDEDRYKCIDLDDSEFNLLEQERCLLDRSALLPFLPITNSTAATIIKFSLIFFGFALVSFIIYISKWDHIKYFCIIVRNATILSMMTHKSESLMRKDSLASVISCYTYDVFVSYSEQDRQWVLEQLLPNLEQTEDINVCLHERDFKVGISILENIIYCMDKSRTLLLVMSESFLLSHWCQFEMHLAQHRMLETRREQLILVLIEDIPKSKRPKTLHFLMKTKTYIVWPQPVQEKATPISNHNRLVKKSKKSTSRKEKDVQILNEERKLFWQRLRKAIHAGVVWEPYIDVGTREKDATAGGTKTTRNTDQKSKT